MQGSDAMLPQELPEEHTVLSRYHLPVTLTPLVGRVRDKAAVCNLLAQPDVHLVTLTGTGGVGKTHLRIDVAASLRELFVDGVCFVPLAAINVVGTLL